MKGSGTGYLVKTGVKSIWQNKLMSLARRGTGKLCREQRKITGDLG